MMSESTDRIVNVLLAANCPVQAGNLKHAFSASTYLHVLSPLSLEEAATNGVAPNGAAAESLPDLVLVDISPIDFTVSNAYVEALERIKSQAGFRGLPVVLAGDVDTLDRLSENSHGCQCSMIAKPADVDALHCMARDFGEYWGTVARVAPRGLPQEPSVKQSVTPLSPAQPIANRLPRRMIKILVVDDNDDDATLFQESLAECEGIQVSHIFDDGDNALELLRGRRADDKSRRPDLVVLDLHMPRKSGLALLQEIKADPTLGNFPVVMLSASRLESDIFECYQHGACAFIEKPPRWPRFREIAKGFAKYWTNVAYIGPRPDKP